MYQPSDSFALWMAFHASSSASSLTMTSLTRRRPPRGALRSKRGTVFSGRAARSLAPHVPRSHNEVDLKASVFDLHLRAVEPARGMISSRNGLATTHRCRHRCRCSHSSCQAAVRIDRLRQER